MLEGGFIKIYRSLLKWEWYDDINTKTVFLHLLLTVSIEDSKWHGIEIKRGSRVASYEVLARETKLSVKQLRTAINHLETTGEVARYKYPKFTVFAINNYDKFQIRADITAELRQGTDKVRAEKGQQYKKVKEDKEDKRNIYYVEIIDYLNLKAGTSYRTNSKSTQQHINARLAEGFTVEDFKTVIDKKCSEWLGDSKMQQYLRPSTLFGTKFEAYLNSGKKGEYYGTGSKIYDGII